MSEKKPNVFVRIGKWFAKLTKDVIGEMKKVVWTPKDELKKSTKLVLVTVLAVGLSIAVVDTAFSSVINLIAGLIG
jgi:preprotein translocase SecE subunit